MNSYKFRLQAAASSLPCARRVQGEYCRCSEMGFTCTIAAALNRHIQKHEIYSPIFPTDFFQAFSKTSCLICITPPRTVPTWYHYLFTMPFLTITNRTDRTKHAHAYTCTHVSVRHKDTSISNRNQEHSACTPYKSKHTQCPQRGQKACNTRRHTVKHTHTQSTALRHRHLHTSPY